MWQIEHIRLSPKSPWRTKSKRRAGIKADESWASDNSKRFDLSGNLHPWWRETKSDNRTLKTQGPEATGSSERGGGKAAKPRWIDWKLVGNSCIPWLPFLIYTADQLSLLTAEEMRSSSRVPSKWGSGLVDPRHTDHRREANTENEGIKWSSAF